jgi:hypothetical protein
MAIASEDSLWRLVGLSAAGASIAVIAAAVLLTCFGRRAARAADRPVIPDTTRAPFNTP